MTANPCTTPYKVIKKISRSVFVIERDTDAGPQKMIKKIVTRANHPWVYLPSFDDIFESNQDLYNRTIYFYNLMNVLGYGPKVESYICMADMKTHLDTYLVILMEYLPTVMTEKIVEEREDEIKTFIKSVHEKGIIHGDLHGGNLMLDRDGKFKMIDFETTFQLNELDVNPLPMEWLDEGFDQTELDEFIEYEETENFKLLP